MINYSSSATSQHPTLAVIDVSDLASPVVETIDLPAGGQPLGVAATKEQIVIADRGIGILTVSTAALASTETTRLAADIDEDGVVGITDFLVLSRNFGQAVESGTNGDINEDGFVNVADFLVLSAQFGRIAQPV